MYMCVCTIKNLLVYSFIKNDFCLHICVCTVWISTIRTQECTECEEVAGVPGSIVTGSWETLGVGAGTWTWVLCRQRVLLSTDPSLRPSCTWNAKMASLGFDHKEIKGC